jgi:hypothetical protein
LSAVETEKLVRTEISRRQGTVKRGAPVSKVEYFTSKAKVLLVFRKQTVDRKDILTALDEARAKAKAAAKKKHSQNSHPKYR